METCTEIYQANICVECGCLVGSESCLWKQYSVGNIRLMRCSDCGKVLDKYVEYDSVLVCIDLALQKMSVYRHLLRNSKYFLRSIPTALFMAAAFAAYKNFNHSAVLEPEGHSQGLTAGVPAFCYSLWGFDAGREIAVYFFILTCVGMSSRGVHTFSNIELGEVCTLVSNTLAIAGGTRVLFAFSLVWDYHNIDLIWLVELMHLSSLIRLTEAVLCSSVVCSVLVVLLAFGINASLGYFSNLEDCNFLRINSGVT